MHIRQANHTDAEILAELILYAMEDIVYAFMGIRDYEMAKKFMHHFTALEMNQYSYQNCWVAEVNGKVIAAVNVYDGENLISLRMPIIHYLKAFFGRDSIPEDETQAGELYIDSLGVNPEYRGKGVATQLLGFIIDKFAIKQDIVLGLLVEYENEDARRLYTKLGFTSVGTKTLTGKSMEHLQYTGQVSDSTVN
jgi:ribosomal protein S18 acetylase RimI-like enzyme